MYFEKSKNPYWDKIKSLSQSPTPALSTFAFTDSDTEQFKGKWLSHWKQKKTFVEIGCNGGHVCLGRAQKNPENFYIGIDWKPKQIYLATEKAHKRGLKNTVFLRAKAERIHYIFAPKEIDFLCIYFPDPWPKKKQLKNRYLTLEWFESILPLLNENAVCEIKTDHPGYFEFIVQQLQPLVDKKIYISEINAHVHQNHPAPLTLDIPEVTLFEKLFIQKNLPIHKIVFHLIQKKI